MLVRRSDVSAFSSIHRDSWVTGANAMSVSSAGSATRCPGLRTNASREDPWGAPPINGFHLVAGATSGPSATLRGPTRRSNNGAIDRCQLPAAMSRWADVIVTCTSFSASANVDGDTGGPDAGAAPKVGGAPGVAADGAPPVVPC